jgi:M6 family metalloprotease-like protein
MKSRFPTVAILLVLFAQFLIQKNVVAVKAYPFPIKYTQPDGTVVNIKLKGDENARWAETIDGYSLLRNAKGGWEYGITNKSGDLICSGVLAKEISQRTLADNSLLQKTQKKLTFSKTQAGILKQAAAIQSTYTLTAFPVSGSINLLMILVEFDDVRFTKSTTDFENLINNSAGSFKNFYVENSYGELTINTTVAGIYTAENEMAYYGTNDPVDDYRVEDLITEAVTLADDDVDFSDFDNDNDGKVDGVYVIYAGYGEEAGGGSTPDAIWAHASSITTLTLDGVDVKKYACSCELRGNDGEEITGIGVICHEFGHSLGAKDYYDTNYDTDGEYPGTDQWDVMAGGSWNNDGDTPAHHNAYTKSKVFNWATSEIVSNVQTITLRDATTFPDFVQINTTKPNEYFLCENRQLNGFNASLPGHGMIIYHVDGDYIADHTFNNNINTGAHQGMYVVSAVATTENGVMTIDDGDINTDDCPWPGTGNITAFDDATTPNSKSWAGENTGKAILNIDESMGNITFCLIVCDENVPSDITALEFGENRIDLAWNLNGNSDPVMVAFSTTNTFGTPEDGTAYSAGDPLSGGGTIIYNGTGNSFSHSSLLPNTTYYYKAWSVIAGSNYSSGITASAKTLCGTSTLPFAETFDGTTIPDCWSQVDHAGEGQIWQFGTTSSEYFSAPVLTGNYAYLNSDVYGSGSSQNVDLITPTLDLSDFSDVNIQFNQFHKFYTGTSASATLSYSIDNGSTWTEIRKWESSTNNPEAFARDLPEVSVQTQVKFKWNYSATWGGGWAIDDISITGTPSVLTDLELTNETVGNGISTCFNALQTITVAGNSTTVDFEAGSIVNLIAGESITFLPGFHAHYESYMNASITTEGNFCDELPLRSTVVQNIQKSTTLSEISENKGTFENNELKVKVYPNPNNGRFTVELFNAEGSSDISIANILGAVVYKSTFTNTNVSEIELTYLQKGLYFVKVKNGEYVKTHKMMVL